MEITFPSGRVYSAGGCCASVAAAVSVGEAHAGMGEEATAAIEVMFFVGFFLALLLERALDAA